MNAYIVCTGTNGRCVSYGYTDTKPEIGKPIVLRDARLVIYWSKGTKESGTGLHRLATYGPLPEGDRITHEVAETGAGIVAQWLEVSESAVKRWQAL